MTVQGPGFSYVTRRTFTATASPPPPREGLVRSDSDMLVNLFSSMIQNIVGDHNVPRTPGHEGGPQRDDNSQPQTPGDNTQEHQGESRRSPPPPPPFAGFFPPGVRLTPRDANSPQATGEAPHVIDLPTYVNSDSRDSDMELTDYRFLASVLSGPPPAREAQGRAPPPFGPAFFAHFFPMGPGGDYVYSQSDLDRVISQLMEQHQGNAPPPAPKEAIDSLPRVKVTKEQVDDGIDCAVCKDDLEVDEEVCKLPCKHIYHFTCVSRWLEAHNVSAIF